MQVDGTAWLVLRGDVGYDSAEGIVSQGLNAGPSTATMVCICCHVCVTVKLLSAERSTRRHGLARGTTQWQVPVD